MSLFYNFGQLAIRNKRFGKSSSICFLMVSRRGERNWAFAQPTCRLAGCKRPQDPFLQSPGRQESGPEGWREGPEACQPAGLCKACLSSVIVRDKRRCLWLCEESPYLQGSPGFQCWFATSQLHPEQNTSPLWTSPHLLNKGDRHQIKGSCKDSLAVLKVPSTVLGT